MEPRSGAVDPDWHLANQRYLMAALGVLRSLLDRHTAALQQKIPHDDGGAAERELAAAAAAMPAPPALEIAARAFGLSPFERDILLACAGVELDGAFASAVAAAHGDPKHAHPTFSLLLAALPGAHWSALTPASPLRQWQLIDVDLPRGLLWGPLRIQERVLHYLAGVEYLDERLLGMVEPAPPPTQLVPSHLRLVDRIAAAWENGADLSTLPVVQLCGNDPSDNQSVAATACARIGLKLHVFAAHALPAGAAELGALMRLWEREATLASSAVLFDTSRVAPDDTARESAIGWLLDHTWGAVLVAGGERRRPGRRPMITVEVTRPSPDEQRALWSEVLATDAARVEGRVDQLITQFSLGATAIRTAWAGAASAQDGEPQDLGQALWDSCRLLARPRLDDLAQRIEPSADWSDLVLPAEQLATLREIAAHVKHRSKVLGAWGFARKDARGLGVSALFAGKSGTGKTRAAEVLAGELRLDLYRIDLSQVVNKYIGETEKNLRRVFDAADEGGVVLLFDEADALFGKRSEVKDSHDRYANIEVSYLLQRMEAYRGLAVLTTNLKGSMDPAFLRRIRFLVQFPFPDSEQRAEIWRRVLPAATPTEGLDWKSLARLGVSGGSIRNIALQGAYLAAAAGEPLRMSHLLRAARAECAKLERPLTDAEIKGWI